jgi:hypothetical protein
MYVLTFDISSNFNKGTDYILKNSVFEEECFILLMSVYEKFHDIVSGVVK